MVVPSKSTTTTIHGQHSMLLLRAGGVFISHLVVWKGAILVYGIHLGDFCADRFALEHRLLFALRKQRDLVVHVLQHDIHGRLGRQLLGTIVLNGQTVERVEGTDVLAKA